MYRSNRWFMYRSNGSLKPIVPHVKDEEAHIVSDSIETVSLAYLYISFTSREPKTSQRSRTHFDALIRDPEIHWRYVKSDWKVFMPRATPTQR